MDANEKLDNPVWYSLSESHRNFAIDFGNIKFYHLDYCPFGGFMRLENISAPIYEYSKWVDNFFVVGEMPSYPNSLKLKNELVCLQMVSPHKINLDIQEDITGLGEEHRDELFHLVNLVQPGYFKKNTSLMGSYFGIFKHNELVAVTGERMKMDKYVEVSAVVTRPGPYRERICQTTSYAYSE